MQTHYAERIKTLPPYLFAAIDQMKKEALSKGADLIDLSIGDPDIPTPNHIIEAMKKAVEKPEHHRYPSYEGMLSFRQAVSDWYKKRFNVDLDPEKEVLSLIGSKEGIGHIPLAFVDPGDIVLVPSPGYPVYPVGTKFAGGIPYFMPLKEENSFLPDIDSIPEDVCKKAPARLLVKVFTKKLLNLQKNTILLYAMTQLTQKFTMKKNQLVSCK
jgi:LL-diaminopimelate aminotransferase